MLFLAEREVNIEESTTPQLESSSFRKLQTGTGAFNKPAIKISKVAGLQKKIVSVDPRPLAPILQDNNSLTVPQKRENERVRFLNMNINTNDIDVIESQQSVDLSVLSQFSPFN